MLIESFLDKNGNPSRLKFLPYKESILTELNIDKSAGIKEILYWFRHQITEYPICTVCKSNTAYFRNFIKGYSSFCSITCKNKDPENRKNIGQKNSANKEIRNQKRYKTNQEKYGVDHALQVKEFSDKAVLATEDWYNSDAFHEKVKRQNKKWFDNRIAQFSERVIPLFPYEKYQGVCKNGTGKWHIYDWKCLKCGKPFRDNIGEGTEPMCSFCYPSNRSMGEMELEEFIRGFNFPIEINNRTILDGKELDIVLESKKLAFEYNGCFMHSEFYGKDKNYHLWKTEQCQKQNIQLVHINGWEWTNKKDIVKSIIANKLGKNKTIGGRNCEIQLLNSKVVRKFLSENHILGFAPGKLYIGLIYNSEVVSVMCLSNGRRNKNYDWEIVRQASKSGLNIIGGAEKLFNFFRTQYNPKSIITYVNRNQFNGNSYLRLGFQLGWNIEPEYFWTNSKDKMIPKHFARKQELEKGKLIEKYDSNLTEVENMHNNKFYRHWDSGKYAFIWNSVSL
jgi:hypothetical protein